MCFLSLGEICGTKICMNWKNNKTFTSILLISFLLIFINVLKFRMSEICRSQGSPVDTTKLKAWIYITIPKIKFLMGFNFWFCFAVLQSEISLGTLSPCWSVLDFWKINLGKSSSTNWIFSLFRTGFLLPV